LALDRVVVNAMPCLLYSRERGLVPTLQGPGWAPGLVWMVVEKRKSVDTTGFKPQTVQSVASRCTDYAIWVPILSY